MTPVSVYIHTPFCPSKCGYCDFNSFAMSGDIVERTVSALLTEIENGPHRGCPAKTIFFGGGTPTFLSSQQLACLLNVVTDTHPPANDCEITSEANPGTVDAAKFAYMRAAGFNRISLGAQSFVDDDLVRLGRVHQSSDVERAVDAARKAGFENVSIDLMFALPGQTMPAWRSNLRRAFELQTEHLSLYCLTLEPNTQFYKQRLRGTLDLPDDDEQVAMYDEAVAHAERAGFLQYEISNFAKPGHECSHNLAYWHNEEYVAYGPGAVERVGDIRWTHIKHPRAYCEAVENGADLSCERETLAEDTHEHERIMLGLRLNEGLAVTPQMNAEAIETLIARDWVVRSNGRLMLTETGRHHCNEAIRALL